MRLSIFLAFLLLLTSCHGYERQSEEAKKTNFPEVEKPVQLSYYQCDYLKQQYDTILSAGDEYTITEIWGVNKTDIADLPRLGTQTLDTALLIESAAMHLKNRFPNINLLSSNYKFERINEQDTSNQKNWFINIMFLYDKRGYFQTVPLLLDGRIILSNTE
jgi:PBP1b-binding outer membrane lipoprotein LpoB